MPQPLRRRRPARGRGFTLIELLVTLTVLGALLMVAVPSFNNAVLGNKLAAFSNSFVAGVQLARSEAIKRNAAMKICRSSDGATCAGSGGWQQGWIIFNDKDGNGSVGSDETRVHYQQALGTDFSFSGDTYTIVFQGTGLSATSGSLTLCRKLPSPGAQERAIT
jgi:type IV fimbrial biogenesis protein FimT